jgi:HK97 family phage prohead protease
MEYRTYVEPIEIRSASKRLVCGRVVPYRHDQYIHEALTERFERGAFNHQLRSPNRVGFYHLHSNQHGGTHIGHGVLLRDDPGGLWGEFKVAASTLGDHYLQMAREGMLRQWSIGFVPDRERRDGTTVVYTRANLFELALVPEGAYGDLAAVAAVRVKVPPMARDTLLAKLPAARLPL